MELAESLVHIKLDALELFIMFTMVDTFIYVLIRVSSAYENLSSSLSRRASSWSLTPRVSMGSPSPWIRLSRWTLSYWEPVKILVQVVDRPSQWDGGVISMYFHPHSTHSAPPLDTPGALQYHSGDHPRFLSLCHFGK